MGKRRFFATEDTDTFDLGDGFWVELKLGLDYAEESELEGAAVRLGVNVDAAARSATPKVEYSIRDQRLLMLALYVVDWNLPGAKDKVVEIPDGLPERQALMGRLDPDEASRIVGLIEAIRARRGEPEAISLEGLDGAEVDPTEPGDGIATASVSSSPNGSDVAMAPSAGPRRA